MHSCRQVKDAKKGGAGNPGTRHNQYGAFTPYCPRLPSSRKHPAQESSLTVCQHTEDGRERDTVSQSKQVFTREHTPFEELHNIDIGQRIGYELTMECLGSETPVSCFIAANYFIAYGVLDALAEKGLRVPEGYSVCVFNNLSSSRISNVGLTTVEHQTDSRARHAFSILMERIKGNDPANEIANMEYSHQLLERRSTAPYRKNSSEEK